MSHPPRSALLAVVAAIAAVAAPAPVPASANPVAADVAAAQQRLKSTVCAGQWNVIGDHTLAARNNGGEATGLEFIHDPNGSYTDARGERWSWRIAKCEFSIDPGMRGCQRRDMVLHEMGHFVYGPSHAGPMSQPELDKLSSCRKSRRGEAIATITWMLPGSKWRISCNLKVTRCVARSTRARFDRHFIVAPNGDVNEGRPTPARGY